MGTWGVGLVVITPVVGVVAVYLVTAWRRRSASPADRTAGTPGPDSAAIERATAEFRNRVTNTGGL